MEMQQFILSSIVVVVQSTCFMLLILHWLS